jgi:5-methylcytosine-specific restriction endonuclease McrA
MAETDALMAPRRKARTEKQVLDIIFRQAKLSCPECGAELCRNDIQRDHMHAIKLGGDDAPENEWYICLKCHDLKTNGNGATSAGSDKHKIAKGKRIRKKAAIARGELPASRKAKIANRQFSKEKRPFPKRIREGA